MTQMFIIREDFAATYSLRKSRQRLVIDGYASRIGGRINRNKSRHERIKDIYDTLPYNTEITIADFNKLLPVRYRIDTLAHLPRFGAMRNEHGKLIKPYLHPTFTRWDAFGVCVEV